MTLYDSGREWDLNILLEQPEAARDLPDTRLRQELDRLRAALDRNLAEGAS
jgi:hypothetical protein